MNASKVRVGSVYAVRVGGPIAPVRLLGEAPGGGWIGRDLVEGDAVLVRRPQELRFELRQTARGWERVTLQIAKPRGKCPRCRVKMSKPHKRWCRASRETLGEP